VAVFGNADLSCEREMDFTEYDSVQRWLRMLTGGTRGVYLQHFRRFCEYAGMTPDELFDERKKDMQSTDEVVRRRADESLNLSRKTG